MITNNKIFLYNTVLKLIITKKILENPVIRVRI